MMMTVDLFETAQRAWNALTVRHDVTAELPSMAALFAGANPSDTSGAAQTVVVNMLVEIMECVGRFSPWYRRPPDAFGVELVRADDDCPPCWALTPMAIRAYATLLGHLTTAIERNIGVILATQFVDELEPEQDLDQPCRIAACQCAPPRTILVQDWVISDAEIICDACRKPFVLARDRL